MNIIELAKEAAQGNPPSCQLHNAMIAEAWTPFLERFAALVRAEEFTEAKEHFGKHLVGLRASVREQSLEEAAQRAEAYAYMSDNFNVLAAEIRSMK